LFRIESVKTSEQIELDREREMLVSALEETCKENQMIHEKLSESALKLQELSENSNQLKSKVEQLEEQVFTGYAEKSILEGCLKQKTAEATNLSKICDSQHAQLVLADFESLNVNQSSESSSQTDLDVSHMNFEFKNIAKALKIAELSNNVMHQKNLALQEHYEAIKGTLAKENEYLVLLTVGN
jgi:predicted nuclease with TOPRIM domain